jgi:hypothetical protein
MGLTEKPFILYDGHATEDNYKRTGLFLKLRLPELEKVPVTYTFETFTIGGHTFLYRDIQSLTQVSLGPGNLFLENVCIQIKRKDGKEFVLFPVQGWSDSGNALIQRSNALFESLNEEWQRIVQAEAKQEQARLQKQLEFGAMDKIRKMIAVSTRLKLEMMQEVLSLDTNTFNNKIFDWATEFKFKIDGDFVIIEGGDVTGFISKLDAEFADWGKKTEGKV